MADTTAGARWTRLKELFANARSLDPAERRRMLEEACAGDPDLRAEVEQLLGNYDAAVQFFAKFPHLAGAVHDLPSAHTFMPGDTIAGRFRVVNVLGQGGMGDVYEVEDLTLNHEHSALKILRARGVGDEESIHRIARELQLARTITHVNVCRVHDVGQHQTGDGGSITFFTMELLRGETLASRLRAGRLTMAEALPLVRQMVMALDAAHTVDVIHGDFKPANIMLAVERNGSQRVVVTDFGLARWNPVATALVTRTQGSLGGGTPAYMAPEQLQRRPITAATDIYALGIVLYQMVTGGYPFDAASTLELALDKLRGVPNLEGEHASALNSRWQTAIAGCLEPSPAKRYHSALDVLSTLEGRSTPRRKWWAVAAAGIVATALVIPAVRHQMRPAPPSSTQASMTIAVLPFANQTSSGASTHDDAAWSAGLAAAVTDRLEALSRKAGGFRVIPSAELAGTGLDTPFLVQRRLKADVILSGEVTGITDNATLTVKVNEESGQGLTVARVQEVPLHPRGATAPDASAFSGIVRLLRLPSAAGDAPKEGGDPGQQTADRSYLVARGYLAAGSLQPAIRALEQTLQIDSTRATVHADLADAYIHQFEATGDRTLIGKAQASADAAVDRDPASARAHLVRGRVYQTTSQRERAVHALKEALQLDPDILDGHRLLGISYEADGDLANAEAEYGDEITRHPLYWRGYNTFGAFLYFHGRYPEAVSNFVRASELAPANLSVSANLAGLYLLQGRFSAAETENARGLRIAKDAVLFNQLGWSYIFQGRYAEAIDPLEQAVRLPKADPVIWSSLARAYRWEGHHPSEAKSAYATALKLSDEYLYVNPDDTEIRANRAYLLSETGRGSEGLREMSATVSAAPSDALVLFTSAVVHELTGDRQGALQALEAAARHGHSMAQIRTHPDLAALRKDPRFDRVLGMAPDAGVLRH
jgi:serine/threonine protein kinase/Tfp pilus assembly protein PilF